MPNENDPPRNRPWNKAGGGGRDDDRDDDRPRRRDRDDDDDDRDDDRPRRRRYEEDDDDGPRRRGSGRAEVSNGLATAGLILGILSFCTAGLTGIPGLICSAIALGKPTGRGMAITGLVLSVLGTLVGAGGMFYGVSRVRSAAMRMQDQNNMKQVGMAMHSVSDQTGGFSAFAQDRRGNISTGLSFRVGLLPFIEQDNLYRRFDLTENWDGPTNRPFSNTPIKTFTAPFDGQEPSANTPYRVYVGGGALFNEDGKSIPLMSVTDGTSNTIMLVHAAEQVPWAAPRELKYSDNAPLPRLGHPAQAGGYNVMMADGSVRFIRDTVSERTMRAMITRAGGEVVAGDF